MDFLDAYLSPEAMNKLEELRAQLDKEIEAIEVSPRAIRALVENVSPETLDLYLESNRESV